MTATDGGGDVFLGFLLVVLLIALYFLPAIISASRGKHSNRSAILALNLLLGWTLIGWVVALVWALAQPPAATAKAGGDTSSEPAAMPTESAPAVSVLRRADIAGGERLPLLPQHVA